MNIPGWQSYISQVLGLTTREFAITKLEGGIINSTIRLTLGVPLATIPGSDRTWDPPLRSCVLKHAPPHMPGAPDQPLSIFRQTVESRALTYLHGSPFLQEGGMEVPELVLLDTQNTVLWMTDLGPMMTLTDYLNARPFGSSFPNEEEMAREIGRRVGEALGRLHVFTLHPSPRMLEQWTDPSLAGKAPEEKAKDVADHLRVLASRLMQDYAQLGADEAERLSRRIGMDDYVLDPGELDERVLSMGDLWPGSVLLAPTSTSEPAEGSIASAPAPEGGPGEVRIAMVDWEFFNAFHPARDLAMLIGHFRAHQLEGQYPSAGSSLAGGELRGLVMTRTEGVARALWEAYRPLMEMQTKTRRWRREALCSWGREMIVVGGDFRKDMLSEEGMTVCVKEGVACLRAAGDATDEVDLKWVKGAPEILRMLL